LPVPSALRGNSFFTHLGRWAAELLLVFVGVYAAFWLNNYQQHRQDANRHDQILAALEDGLKDEIGNAKTEGAKQDKVLAQFRRALNAGEMPPLHSFAFTTDYSPTDTATLLQSGGIELLDVKTLTALRNLESVIRGGLSRMAHYERLSDEMIAPNLDQDVSFFLRSRHEETANAI
jgi:hypothetical protein